MALPNVIINLANGNLGRIALGDDGVAGLVLTGAAVAGKVELNKVYLFGSSNDIAKYGITAENNPLAYKELTAFFAKTADSGEIYLILQAPATTLTAMCAMTDGAPLRKLLAYAKGRIRLVGINRLMPVGYEKNVATTGIDKDAVDAAAAAQELGNAYAAKMMPCRILIPAIGWDGSLEKLFKPREASYNRVMMVMASDDVGNKSAAIGQVLGRLARYSVNRSAARVKSGALATTGYLTNGQTPEEAEAMLDALDEAGYVFYRTYAKREGYYLNDDHMAAPLSDDYSNMTLARVADKAQLIIYSAYIDEIKDDLELEDGGTIPAAMCTYYEGKISNAINAAMEGEISNFTPYVDPDQNVSTTARMDVSASIRPRGALRDIRVTLGLTQN